MAVLDFKGCYVPHSTQCILDLDIAELLVRMCLDLLEEFALCRQNLLEGLLEIRLRRRRVAACLYYANKMLMLCFGARE
jgi:hypothetical protein